MNAWITFWGILLLVTLILYTVLVINVTIGGIADIRQMLKKLSEDDSGNDNE